MEPRDRVGDAGMQVLPARSRDAGQQRLTHEFVGEDERPPKSLGARDDYSHLLRLLDDGEKFVHLDLADGSQKFKAEAAPDYRGGGQCALFTLVEPLQPAADDQPHVLWNVVLGDLDVGAELAGLIEDLALFEQMPVHLFDEEWISLAFSKNQAGQTFGNLALAQRM